MVRKFIIIACAIVFAAGISRSASALGVGGYVGLGAGTSSGGGSSYGSGTDIIPTGGVMIDTAPAKNKIFNYRFTFGGGRMFSGNLKLDKVGMTHTLGLSPVSMRGDEARFFFGPRIGMHYLGCNVTIRDINALELIINPVWAYYDTKTIRLDMFRIDLGLVLLGFNFNFGQFATLTFEFGVDYGVMLGKQNGKSLTMSGYEGFCTIGCMYRINDNFIEVTARDDNKIRALE